MSKSIRQIHDELKQLDGFVLSIYLNTNPGSEDWKIRLKNGLKKTEQYIAASDPDQVLQFNEISKKVDQEIMDNKRALTNSVICFATTNELFIYHLQLTVENDFQWKNKPATAQLDELTEKYSKTGVILLQRNKVTLITSFLGELVNETHYEFDLENEDWKQYKGVAFGNIYSSSANHREKYDRRLKENQARWYKNIVPTIQQYARKHNWNGVHFAGPVELTRDLKDQLNLNIKGETTRNYGGKSAHAILDRTILAANA